MAKIMSVQVKKCQLRNKPSFLGKVVTMLGYGDKVEIAKEENSWVKVSSAKNKGGWIHISALTEKEIIVNANSRDINTSASSDEIALAGKGFNKQVEEQFKQNNKGIDFSWVDKMEKIIITQDEKQAFLKNGGLIGKEAAAS